MQKLIKVLKDYLIIQSNKFIKIIRILKEEKVVEKFLFKKIKGVIIQVEEEVVVNLIFDNYFCKY